MINRLEFDSIEVSFSGRKLLSSIYMSCETGAVTGLLGRNGCGKTTLLKIVFGAISHEQKSVRVNGCSLGLDYLPQSLIAYLPQQNLIPDYLTLRRAFFLFGIDEAQVMKAFPEAAEMMHLKPFELSGGYLRIFETFLILRSKAMFCLLDEPFTGLTPLYIEKIKTLITEAKDEKGLIITDHMYKHVADIADRLYLLANGQTYQVVNQEQLITLGYVNNL